MENRAMYGDGGRQDEYACDRHGTFGFGGCGPAKNSQFLLV
jgi:hypothetical protein